MCITCISLDHNITVKYILLVKVFHQSTCQRCKEGMRKTYFCPRLNPGFATGIPVHITTRQKQFSHSLIEYYTEVDISDSHFTLLACILVNNLHQSTTRSTKNSLLLSQWSFGVTCWEIFSLARTPYPSIANSEIVDYLVNGHRLPKPTLCRDKM